MLIPAGAALEFQLHDTVYGQAIDDRSGIGFVFARFSPLANSALSKATSLNLPTRPDALRREERSMAATVARVKNLSSKDIKECIRKSTPMIATDLMKSWKASTRWSFDSSRNATVLTSSR
jgi:hypothetical protein